MALGHHSWHCCHTGREPCSAVLQWHWGPRAPPHTQGICRQHRAEVGVSV